MIVFESNVTDFALFKALEIVPSTVAHDADFPFSIGPVKRALSYKPKMEAIICGFTAPFVKPKSLFPLIKIGRPSLVFTKILA